VRLYHHQWLGILILTLIPVIAMTGLLGDDVHELNARTTRLDISVRLHEPMRSRRHNTIEIRLHNRTHDAITATVSFDTSFIAGFSQLRALPDFQRPYDIRTEPIAAGAVQLITVELLAEQPGRHSGMLRIGASDTAAIPLNVLILP
jgi:hypothetical protein